MYLLTEVCDPKEFYQILRPYLAGWVSLFILCANCSFVIQLYWNMLGIAGHLFLCAFLSINNQKVHQNVLFPSQDINELYEFILWAL